VKATFFLDTNKDRAFLWSQSLGVKATFCLFTNIDWRPGHEG